MEIDPPTTAVADQMRRPNKMLSSRDKDYKFEQNENEKKWDITYGCKLTTKRKPSDITVLLYRL